MEADAVEAIEKIVGAGEFCDLNVTGIKDCDVLHTIGLKYIAQHPDVAAKRVRKTGAKDCIFCGAPFPLVGVNLAVLPTKFLTEKYEGASQPRSDLKDFGGSWHGMKERSKGCIFTPARAILVCFPEGSGLFAGSEIELGSD